MNEGLFIVLSGPSGAGKTSLVDRALKEYSELQKPVSYTTRSSREGEVDGQSYYFLNREKFREFQEQKAFVEWAEVYGELYGTSVEEIRKIWVRGKIIIKDLDIQGMQSVKKAFSKVITVFVAPPSIDALRQRLLKRGQEAPSLSDRLLQAEGEMIWKNRCDHSLINEDFERAWEHLKKIIEKVKNL
ncbi:MAG: guanylate kinase [Bdellovibrionales bacterium]|nr:guanylate kinase [Bdellovibrionales bacterium]